MLVIYKVQFKTWNFSQKASGHFVHAVPTLFLCVDYDLVLKPPIKIKMV